MCRLGLCALKLMVLVPNLRNSELVGAMDVCVKKQVANAAPKGRVHGLSSAVPPRCPSILPTSF